MEKRAEQNREILDIIHNGAEVPVDTIRVHTSKHVGVSWKAAAKKWQAQSPRIEGKQKHLGYFHTEEAAALAVEEFQDAHEAELHEVIEARAAALDEGREEREAPRAEETLARVEAGTTPEVEAAHRANANREERLQRAAYYREQLVRAINSTDDINRRAREQGRHHALKDEREEREALRDAEREQRWMARTLEREAVRKALAEERQKRAAAYEEEKHARAEAYRKAREEEKAERKRRAPIEKAQDKLKKAASDWRFRAYKGFDFNYLSGRRAWDCPACGHTQTVNTGGKGLQVQCAACHKPQALNALINSNYFGWPRPEDAAKRKHSRDVGAQFTTITRGADCKLCGEHMVPGDAAVWLGDGAIHRDECPAPPPRDYKRAAKLFGLAVLVFIFLYGLATSGDAGATLLGLVIMLAVIGVPVYFLRRRSKRKRAEAELLAPRHDEDDIEDVYSEDGAALEFTAQGPSR